MGYECRVERDSVSPAGVRLTTFVIKYPRRVLAEEVTHRLVYDNWGDVECYVTSSRAMTINESKNSASSRAIPLAKMVEAVQTDLFYPQWTKNQSGMQGEGVSDPLTVEKGNQIWDNVRRHNVEAALQLNELGFHKQDCNRLLEPFAWITQVVTSTAWDNFFALRCDEFADPHLRHIARLMFLHRRNSSPVALEPAQWHLPFVPLNEQMSFRFWPGTPGPLPEGEMPDLIQCSAARCAWISYMNHDRDGTLEQMKKTYHRLITSRPVHASPVEHQATPYRPGFHQHEGRTSNLRGYLQARKLVPHEECTSYSPSDEVIKSWGIEL